MGLIDYGVIGGGNVGAPPHPPRMPRRRPRPEYFLDLHMGHTLPKRIRRVAERRERAGLRLVYLRVAIIHIA